MKKITQILLFPLFLLLFMGARQEARACVDYHNDSVYVIVHYDSTNFTDVSITLTNLRLFGGNPNQFCSCGVNSITNVFSDIIYVAFVDSGTINPVPGFDVWDASANATNAWAGVVASGNWHGFVSMVNGNGLTPNGPVELVIRARLPVGYYFSIMDSAISVMKLGTDEWFNSSQVLGNTHQSVSGVDGPIDYIPEAPGSSWFTTLDAALMVGRKDPVELPRLQVYPVPATDRLYVSLPDRAIQLESVEVYDMTGKLIHQQQDLHGPSAMLDIAALPQGAYLLKVKTDKGMEMKKFIKAD